MRMVVTSLYQLSHVVNLTEDAIGSVTIHLAVNECNYNRYQHQALLAEALETRGPPIGSLLPPAVDSTQQSLHCIISSGMP